MKTFNVTFDNTAYSDDSALQATELEENECEALTKKLKQQADWPNHWDKVVSAVYCADDEAGDKSQTWYCPVTVRLRALNEQDVEKQIMPKTILAQIVAAVGEASAQGKTLSPEENWDVLDVDAVSVAQLAPTGRRRMMR